MPLITGDTVFIQRGDSLLSIPHHLWTQWKTHMLFARRDEIFFVVPKIQKFLRFVNWLLWTIYKLSLNITPLTHFKAMGKSIEPRLSWFKCFIPIFECVFLWFTVVTLWKKCVCLSLSSVNHFTTWWASTITRQLSQSSPEKTMCDLIESSKTGGTVWTFGIPL